VGQNIRSIPVKSKLVKRLNSNESPLKRWLVWRLKRKRLGWNRGERIALKT
jgi:hypothetical protein